jgi:methionyl-tRNA formyltransferase
MPLRIVFMGTPDLAVPALQAMAQSSHPVALVVTQPDREKGRGRHLAKPPVKMAAEELGLPVFQPRKANRPESLERIQAAQPDVIAVVAFGQILSRALLDVPRLGCFNLHASLLPKYRGAAPITYAVWNGETETGVTIMKMVERLDAGDVAIQVRTPIGPEETSGELHDRLAVLGAPLFVEFLDRLDAGGVSFTPQDDAQATLAPLLKKEQGLVDWSSGAEVLCRFIRAMTPWPGAYTFRRLGGGDYERILLWKAAPAGGFGPARPGTVQAVTRDEFVVATGQGGIRILGIQAEGKRRMSASEYLRGHPVHVGESLGTPGYAP